MAPKKTIYLSGPMSNLPNFNFPMFNHWAKYWRERGYKVINPAENLKWLGHCTCLPWEFYIIYDMFILWITRPTHIFMLQNWELSTGAQIEILFCNKKNAKILYETPPAELREYNNEEDYQ